VAEGGGGEVGEYLGVAAELWVVASAPDGDQRRPATRGPSAAEEAYGAGAPGRCSLGDLARGGLRTKHARRRRTEHEAAAGGACGSVLVGGGTRCRDAARLGSSWTADGRGDGEESK
jgi:hypothetical protein